MTGCSCHNCRFGLGDPVERASHAVCHIIAAERDILPPRRFPALEPDHESRLLSGPLVTAVLVPSVWRVNACEREACRGSDPHGADGHAW